MVSVPSWKLRNTAHELESAKDLKTVLDYIRAHDHQDEVTAEEAGQDVASLPF